MLKAEGQRDCAKSFLAPGVQQTAAVRPSSDDGLFQIEPLCKGSCSCTKPSLIGCVAENGLVSCVEDGGPPLWNLLAWTCIAKALDT